MLISLFGKNPKYIITFTSKFFILEKRLNNRDEWKTIFSIGRNEKA